MNYIAGLILAVFAATFLHQPVQAYDFEGCYDCHEKTLQAHLITRFLHTPFRKQQCGECHAVTSVSLQEEATKKKSSVGIENRKKIKWLGDSATAVTSHGFLLAGDKVGDTLVVELHGAEGKMSRQEIAIPPLYDLSEVEDSGKPPAISDVKVLEVQRGVFLSVTIGWRTDSLTDALVRYGYQDLTQTSETANRLGRYHQAVLYNLQPDMTYRFAVVSQDLFGRTQTSETLTFSTSKPLKAMQSKSPTILPEDGQEIRMVSNFKRLGTDYLVELALEEPASVFIGSRGAVRNQGEANETTREMGWGDDKHHIGLSSKDVVSIGACRMCHQFHNAASHPVNVYPKAGMTIPPEYPTLPDGRITCSSCHTPHSSNYEKLVRKRGRRELCVGCHRNML